MGRWQRGRGREAAGVGLDPLQPVISLPARSPRPPPPPPQHFGPVDKALAEFAAETGILAAASDFPKKCGDLVLDWAARAGAVRGRALDLGCAVGRSTFELAREYGEVVGIDISQTFIDGALPRAARCMLHAAPAWAAAAAWAGASCMRPLACAPCTPRMLTLLLLSH